MDSYYESLLGYTHHDERYRYFFRKGKCKFNRKFGSEGNTLDCPKPSDPKFFESLLRNVLWDPNDVRKPTGEFPLRFKPGSVHPRDLLTQLHAITFAPTGAGKTRYQVIPMLLSCTKSIVVVDPKGEIAAATADYRKSIGQEVYILNPFEEEFLPKRFNSSFNPLDILHLEGVSLEDEAMAIAKVIAESQNENGGRSFNREPYWDIQGTALLTAIIMLMHSTLHRDFHTLKVLWEFVHDDDLIYTLARFLDKFPCLNSTPAWKSVLGDKPKNKEKSESAETIFMNSMAYRNISSTLGITDVTRSGITSTTMSYLRFLSSPALQDSMSCSSFSLKDFVDGRSMTIYIVIPADKLRSHSPVIRLWLQSLIRALYLRRSPPLNPTLFLVDEAAHLGHMECLQDGFTLLRTYGVQLWLFFQSVQNLKQNYPNSWQSMLDNTGLISCFGARNHRTRKEYKKLLNVSMEELESLSSDEHLFVEEGIVERAWLCDYLSDKQFAGKYKPNPYHMARIMEPENKPE